MNHRTHGQRLCLRFCAWLAAILLGASVTPATAQTYKNCTVATGNVALGSHSSLSLASQPTEGSGGGGLSCTSLLGILATSYIKVRVENSTFLLTGGAGSPTIPFTLSATQAGAAIPVGTEFDFTSFQLLSLFTGPGGSLPLYITIDKQSGLRAGTYTGTVDLRWYFSVCSGILVVCDYSQSPGFVRPVLGSPTWGIGAPTTMTITLVVENDCVIAAPDLSFGTAPFAASFSEATRTINIRCSAGAAYSVGLNNGSNFNAGWRRMRRGATTDYLRYEIYQTPSSNNRWGSVSAERRNSETAETNPAIYDGDVQQGFTYRARIDPAQPTPGMGTYTDSIIVDVQF